jgi:hypothetical protein
MSLVVPAWPGHIDRARERIGRHGFAHQCCQLLGALAEGRQAWSPPSPGPRPSGRSQARLRRAFSTPHSHLFQQASKLSEPQIAAVRITIVRSSWTEPARFVAFVTIEGDKAIPV